MTSGVTLVSETASMAAGEACSLRHAPTSKTSENATRESIAQECVANAVPRGCNLGGHEAHEPFVRRRRAHPAEVRRRNSRPVGARPGSQQEPAFRVE